MAGHWPGLLPPMGGIDPGLWAGGLRRGRGHDAGLLPGGAVGLMADGMGRPNDQHEPTSQDAECRTLWRPWQPAALGSRAATRRWPGGCAA